jgi:nitrogen fixation-related uncharacterized protein
VPSHGSNPGAQQAPDSRRSGTHRRPAPVVTPAAVTSLLLAALLVACAGLTALWAAKSNQYAGARTVIGAQQGDLRDLQGSLKAAKDETDELKRQRQVISACLRLMSEAELADRRGDLGEVKAKVDEATPVCDEADKYLDPAAAVPTPAGSADRASATDLSVV